MARILQIRRGSTAQNNNFTGLAGEITFDTEEKTLRVHDGETLGGFTLARADKDSSGTGEDFDINSVPDEFWQSLFDKFAQTPLNLLESRLANVSTNSSVEYIFNTDKTAKIVQVFL